MNKRLVCSYAYVYGPQLSVTKQETHQEMR